jgi:DtxR family Mn-dependent transcriptional regulator
MAAALGDPTVDPHGDPIPDRELEVDAQEPDAALSELEPGDRATFSRVSDSDPEMLRYLDDRGIRPGVELEITAREPFDGPLTVRCEGADHLLGGELPRRMRVQNLARGVASG